MISGGEMTQIDTYQGMSLITPAPDEELLDSVASYTQRTFTETSGGKIAEQIEEVPLYDFDFCGRAAVPTGLIPAVVDGLQKEGREVVINDHREFDAHHTPAKQVWNEATKDDRQFLKALKDNPLGQIEICSTAETIARMQLVCDFFPDARVLVPVAQKKFAWYLWNELRKHSGDRDVRLKKKVWPRTPPRCLITTYQPLVSCNPKHWDIILLPDALRATQERFSEALGVFHGHPCRCYSFVRSGQKLNSRAHIRLEAISGPKIYEIAKGKPAVEVLWLQPPESKQTGCETRTLDWKRAAYWRNDRRNDFIAGVARAFAERKVKKLRKYGVRFHDNSPQFANAEKPAVVVLVESREHGRELLKRLEGWSMLDRAEGKRTTIGGSGAKGKIITAVRAAADGFEADVAIHAAGGAGIGSFQNTIGETSPEAGKSPALIVDFSDCSDGLSLKDARSRRRAYIRKVWDRNECPDKPSANGQTSNGRRQGAT